MAKNRICSVEGCGKPHDSHGFCGKHQMRMKRRGEINPKPRIVHGSLKEWINRVAINYKGDDCLIWPFGSFPSGYAQMSDQGHKTNASRYICAVAHGAPPSDIHEAAHSCGNGHGGCVSPNHLRWATPIENNSDKTEHGTALNGEKNHRSKLTSSDVAEILNKLKMGETQRTVAKQYGVSQPTISLIVQGKNWKYLRLTNGPEL